MKKIIIIIFCITLLTGCTARDNNTFDVYLKSIEVKNLIDESLGKRYNPCEKYFEEYSYTNSDTNYSTCMSNLNMIENQLNYLNDLVKINSDADIRDKWSKQYETSTTVIKDIQEFYKGLYSLNIDYNITTLSEEDFQEIKQNTETQTNLLADKLNIKWYQGDDQAYKIDSIAHNIINYETFHKKVKTACANFKTCRSKM